MNLRDSLARVLERPPPTYNLKQSSITAESNSSCLSGPSPGDVREEGLVIAGAEAFGFAACSVRSRAWSPRISALKSALLHGKLGLTRLWNIDKRT